MMLDDECLFVTGCVVQVEMVVHMENVNCQFLCL